jgi:hypothetical protein
LALYQRQATTSHGASHSWSYLSILCIRDLRQCLVDSYHPFAKMICVAVGGWSSSEGVAVPFAATALHTTSRIGSVGGFRAVKRDTFGAIAIFSDPVRCWPVGVKFVFFKDITITSHGRLFSHIEPNGLRLYPRSPCVITPRS